MINREISHSTSNSLKLPQTPQTKNIKHKNNNLAIAVDIDGVSKEISPHCRQVIFDQHRWLNSWSEKTWVKPCLFGDMTLQVAHARPFKGTCLERFKAMEEVELAPSQWCYSHGQECPINTWRTCSDIDMSGLPCEENSRANVNRRFLDGRFSDLYALWAQRHRRLRTPLVILENTPDAMWAFEVLCGYIWWTYGQLELPSG